MVSTAKKTFITGAASDALLLQGDINEDNKQLTTRTKST